MLAQAAQNNAKKIRSVQGVTAAIDRLAGSMDCVERIAAAENHKYILKRCDQDVGELVATVLDEGGLGRLILKFEEALDFVRHLIVLSRATDMWR